MNGIFIHAGVYFLVKINKKGKGRGDQKSSK